MTRNNKRLILSILWILIGIVLLALSISGKIEGSFYSGMGGGLIAVGILQTIRHIKYNKNAEYREKIDTETNDERNRFIRMKAWSVTGYIMVLGSAVLSIVANVPGRGDLSRFLVYVVCVEVLIYWVSCLIINKRN